MKKVISSIFILFFILSCQAAQKHQKAHFKKASLEECLANLKITQNPYEEKSQQLYQAQLYQEQLYRVQMDQAQLDDYNEKYDKNPDAYNAYRDSLLNAVAQDGLEGALRVMRPLGRAWFEGEFRHLGTREKREYNLFESIHDDHFEGLLLLEKLIVFLAYGINIDAQENIANRTLLYAVTEYRCWHQAEDYDGGHWLYEFERQIEDAKALVSLLIMLGAQTKVTTYQGSLLHITSSCHKKMGPWLLKTFLSAGVKLEDKDIFEETPLFSVAYHFHWSKGVPQVLMLLAAGARIDCEKGGKKLKNWVNKKVGQVITEAQAYVEKLTIRARRELNRKFRKPSSRAIRNTVLELLEAEWRYKRHKAFHERRACSSPREKEKICLVCRGLKR